VTFRVLRRNLTPFHLELEGAAVGSDLVDIYVESDGEATAPPTSVYVEDSDSESDQGGGASHNAASAQAPAEPIYVPDSDEEDMQVAASLYIPESGEGKLDADLSDVYISGSDKDEPLPNDIYVPLSDGDGTSDIYVPPSDGEEGAYADVYVPSSDGEEGAYADVYVPSSDGEEGAHADVYVPSSEENDGVGAGSAAVVYGSMTARPIGSYSPASFADFEDSWMD